MNKKNKKADKRLGLIFVKKAEKIKLPLLHVEWKDHTVLKTPSWVPIEDTRNRVVIAFTVGWLIDETEDTISLAQNVSDGGHVSEIMTILKSCIVKKTKL